MKKFYTLAIAACAAMAMNAQVYFVGPFGEATWDPANPGATATLNADGNWEATINNIGGFKASTVKGTWDEFNPAAFSFSESGNVTKELLGEFHDVVPCEANTNLPWTGDYTIVVTPDYKQMKITTTTPEPAEPLPAYIVGGMTDWGIQDKWKMTCDELFHYTFVAKDETKIPANTEFKIATSNTDGSVNWTMINYTAGGEVLADGEPSPVPYNDGANMYVAEDFEGTITLVIQGYNQPGEITFTAGDFGGVDNVTISNDAKAEYFNLQGVRVAQPENGLYIVRRGNDVKKVLVK